MKQVLQRMAEYNAKAMEAMLEVLERAPADLRGKDVGVYFKSIDGIVEHMAWAIVLWLKRYASFGSYPCLQESELVTRPLDAIRDEVKGNRVKTAALLRDADSLLARFVDELPVLEFERRVQYQTTDGQPFERTFWHTIMQVLNHGTHHRGEISAILDMNGVSNDFNGFTTYMP